MKRTPLIRKTPLKKTALKKKGKPGARSTFTQKRRAPTGERDLFVKLYHERGGISEVSGTQLIPPPEEGDEQQWRPFISQWSHILPKGTYPDLRLEPYNIVGKTIQEHQAWELEKWTLVDKPEWKWVFQREAELKYEANTKYGVGG